MQKTGLMRDVRANIFMYVCVALFFNLIFVDTCKSDSPQVTLTADLTQHPLYSTYNFGHDRRVIDFGTQALAIPAGVITETMLRDNILKKALKARNMEIRFHPFLKGADVNFFMKQKNLEAAISSDMPTVTMASTSSVVVAAMTKQSFSSVVAKKRMQVRDLRGKRIGNADGSTGHFALLQALSSANIKESEVQLIPLEANAMPDALAQGRVDAFSAWEPTPTIALNRSDDFAIISRFLSLSYLYFSKSFVEENPKEAREIIAALIRALRWLKQSDKNTLAASQWAHQALKELTRGSEPLPVDQIASLVKSDILEVPSMPVIPERDLKDTGFISKAFQFLKAQKKIPADSEWTQTRSSFDHSMVKEVLANPVKYRLNRFDFAAEPHSIEK